MNTDDELRGALQRRAEGVGDDHPLTLDDVATRARTIRRRRVTAGGLAAAVVLAVAVPVGASLADRTSAGPDLDPVAPTPTRTERAVDQGPEEPVEVRLEVGVPADDVPPQVGYVTDEVLHRPDGSQATTEATYQEVAVLGDGWAALRTDENGNGTLDLLGPSGEVLGSTPAQPGIAVSEDRTVVAFTRPDGTLMTAVAGEAAPRVLVRTEAGSGTQVRAVIGSRSCRPDAPGGGCTVFYEDASAFPGQARYVTSRGTGEKLPAGLTTLDGLAPDRALSGLVSATDDGSCSKVVGPAWTTRWRTCEHSLGQFSPDGRHLLGYAAYRDGFGDLSISLLDAETGDVVVAASSALGRSPASVVQAVWENDESVLLTAWQDDSWHLLRLTMDGSLTTLTPDGVGDTPEKLPLHVAVQP